MHGKFAEYFENGQMKIRNLQNDNLHGKYDEYFENGQMKVSGTYKNGVALVSGRNLRMEYLNEGPYKEIEYFLKGKKYDDTMDGRVEDDIIDF